jgi:excisionase family DNA binding protein
MSKALTVQQLADYLSVDAKTVYRMVRASELPGFKVRGAWRFRQEDVDRWIEKQKEAAHEPRRPGEGQHSRLVCGIAAPSRHR